MNSIIERTSARLQRRLAEAADPDDLPVARRGELAAELLCELLPLDPERRAESVVLPCYRSWAGATPVSDLVIVGLVLLALYLAACCWWPFVSCPRPACDKGKVRSPSGRAWRPCWWCKGKGSRVRLGRRLYEAMSGKRKHT